MIIEEIRKELKLKVDLKYKEGVEKYFKEGIKTYGVRVPDTRIVARKFYNDLKKDYKFKDFSELSEKLLASGWFEEGIICISFMDHFKKNFSFEEFNLFEKWLNKYVSNWAHCDILCTDLVGNCIKNKPELVENLLKWTNSNNRWVRRGSAVSLVLHARNGRHLDYVFEIAERLITDRDDMVEKGVGWVLKEASKSDQRRVFDFLMNFKDKASRVTLRYAIEKMPEDLRKEVLKKV